MTPAPRRTTFPTRRPVCRAAVAVLAMLAIGARSAPARAEVQTESQIRSAPHRHVPPPHPPTHHQAHTAHHGGHPSSHKEAGGSHPAHHAPPHNGPAHHGPAHPGPIPAVALPATPPKPLPPPLPPAPLKGTMSGLPLPRFAALRADEVNLRSGPGTRYPIQWVYKRRELPVKIEREFDVWRLVEDPDGTKGWVHQATLVGNRSFMVLPPPGEGAAEADRGTAGETAPGAAASPSGTIALHAAAAEDAAVVALLKPGVIGRIRLCAAGSDWCKVSVKDYSGWLRREAFWGLLPGETIQPP